MKNEKEILDILYALIYEQSFCCMSGQSWCVDMNRKVDKIYARLNNKEVKKSSHNKQSKPKTKSPKR